MRDVRRKYLKLLAIELEDLQRDVALLMKETEERMQRGEISHYVCFENMAVMRNEVLDIESVAELLGEFRPDDYPDLDALVADLQRRFRERLQEFGFPEAAMSLIRRKLDKVARYIREGD